MLFLPQSVVALGLASRCRGMAPKTSVRRQPRKDDRAQTLPVCLPDSGRKGFPSMSFWDDKYAGEDFVYGVAPNDFLRAVAHHIPPGRVLCLAEGEGRNAVYLAELGYEVLAVDQSHVGLTKATRLATARNVKIETLVTDLADFQFPEGAFSAVVSIWCHVPKTLRVHLHASVRKALRASGVVVLEAYRPPQLRFATGGPPVADLMMDLAEVQKELVGFDWILAQEAERDVYEGKGHHGRSATIQLLGKTSA